MSCKTIYNIIDSSANPCYDVCTYKYDYSAKKLNISIGEENNFLLFKHDTRSSQYNDGNSDQVQLNNVNSIVTTMALFRGSFQQFNSKFSDGELYIEHLSDDSKITVVCIPLINSGNENKNDLDILISEIPSDKGQLTKGNSYQADLNLNKIMDLVKLKPFNYYQGPYPVGSCDNYINIIVTKSIYITDSSVKKLKLLGLKKQPDKKKPKIKQPEVLLNNNTGPEPISKGGDGTFIYTGCEIGGEIISKNTKTRQQEEKEEEDKINTLIPLQWVVIVFLILFFLFVIFVTLKPLLSKSLSQGAGSAGRGGAVVFPEA